MYIITYNDNNKYIGLKISNNEIVEYDILLDELSDNNIYLGIDNIEHNSYINLLNLYNPRKMPGLKGPASLTGRIFSLAKRGGTRLHAVVITQRVKQRCDDGHI